jgi:hypothetical protein
MKTIILACIMAAAMNAQDVNGVSLSGTPDNPMIVNNSTKPVIGWTVTRFDSDGNELPADRIILVQELLNDRPGIKPGETQVPQVHNVINFSARGSAVSVKLDSVLFADGEVAGPDTMAPEFGALEGFTHQLQSIQEDFGKVPRIINVPSAHSNAPGKTANTIREAEPLAMRPYAVFPPFPCSSFGACYPIAFYCCDENISGLIYGTPAGVETRSVGGTAVCGPGSPQQGYGIGDNVNATIFCPVSMYYGTSSESSRRPDFQADRIVQAFAIYDPENSALQNNARFHELCAYSELPNRGGQGPFGKAVVEYNYNYGCP